MDDLKTGQDIVRIGGSTLFTVGDYSTRHNAFRYRKDGRDMGIIRDGFSTDPKEIKKVKANIAKAAAAQKKIQVADRKRLRDFKVALSALLVKHGADISATQTSGDDQGVGIALVFTVGIASEEIDQY